MRNGDSPTRPGPAPFILVNQQGRSAVLLTCDHASNHVPEPFAGLGLDERTLGLHIAWDIGAAAVTRQLAASLDAPAVLATVSRLVIDCNRRPEQATSIPEVSDGIAIPGNRDLHPGARRARQETWFHPYHAAIGDQLSARDRPGRQGAMIAVHSFTPVMAGFVRPWPVGVLWGEDGRIARPLIAALAAQGLEVGDNQPYSGRHPDGGYAIARHGGQAGRPHVAIELRQDEVGDAAGQARWAGILDRVLRPVLADLGLLDGG